MSSTELAKNVLTYFMVLIGLMMLLSMGASSVSLAQGNDGYIRYVRPLELNDAGDENVLNPAGLAYSFGFEANLFYLIRAVDTSNPTTIAMMSPYVESFGSVMVDTSGVDPINTAFDNLRQQLLLLDTAANELIAIATEPDANLDSAPEAVTRFDIEALELQQPEGMTVDSDNGALFILDRGALEIVRIEPDAQGDFDGQSALDEGRVSRIDLQNAGLAKGRGLALNPDNEHLYVFNTATEKIHELSQTGQLVATLDMAPFELVNIQGLVFGLSGDLTDDPAKISLYVADTGLDPGLNAEFELYLPLIIKSGPPDNNIVPQPDLNQSQQLPGQIVEFDLEPPPVGKVTIAETVQATLERTTPTSAYNPPSPDPSGLAYIPTSNRLLISDGEVNEMPIFTGDNLFETSLSGVLQTTFTALPLSNEPTGVAYNPTNGYLYFSDDTGTRSFNELNPGPDGQFNTSDDISSTIATSPFGSTDPEGIAYDTWQGHIFWVDGVNAEVYEIDPGPNGIFEGDNSDDTVTNFDTSALGLPDPEGVEFNPDNGHLYIQSDRANLIVETMRDGTPLRNIDISPVPERNAAGLAYAPASNGSGQKNIYIVDRAVDNGTDPNENDGVLFEISFPPFGGPVNQAPVVSAGPDQSVILTDGAVLDGTVTDDGLPNPPATATTTWSQISGPGTVTFANTNAVDTIADFSQTGTYVLRLTASDSQLSTHDEVTITVTSSSGNLAPSVNAGPDQNVTLPASAVLDGTVIDDGLPNPPGVITTTWSLVSGPGTVTFGDSNTADTTANFSTAGTYVLRLTADDSELTTSDVMTATVYESGTLTSIDVRVAASSDDAEERSTGGISLASSDLEFVFDQGGNQTVGMRFNGLTTPQGASIVNAHIQFQVEGINTVATSLTIQGEDADNATTFSTVNGSISARPKTTAAVPWSPVPWTTIGAAGPDQQTPDIASVIQEIVNRPGWASGNSLVILVTGTGERTAESFNSNLPAVAPLLHVEYSTEPVNQAPVVAAGPDQSITLPDNATLAGTAIDDGLPNPPGVMTTTWSMMSGTGTVTFTDESVVNTTASFSEAGTYVLQLEASDSELITSDEVSITVTLPPPLADFIGSPTDGDAPLTVTFTDQSTNSPTTWNWTFGDGDTSIQQHPIHTYTLPGNYTVTLTAGNAFGSDIVTKTDYITVTLPPPAADFIGSPIEGDVPLVVTFTDQTTNSPTSWSWDFGDSNISTLQNPTHTYTSTGIYTVTLTASNASGSNTVTKTDYITVTAPPAPVAEFSGTPTNGYAPLTVTFTDQTTNSPTAWSWTFGDGDTSIQQNPVHTYTVPGSYTVTLTAGNVSGSDAITRTDYITVTPPPPVAGIAGFPRSGKAPLTVSFLDLSTNDPTTWNWTFGDGDTSIQQNPVHTYTLPGSYTVTLTVSNAFGSDTLTETDYITLDPETPPNQAPLVKAGLDQSITLPAEASLDGTVTDDGLPNPPGVLITTWSVVSGPGTVTFANATAVDTTASFSAAGTYVLRLTANDGELSAFDELTIIVNEAVASTFEVQVVASSDDAEETNVGGMDLTSGDLDMGVTPVGLRFAGVTIPPGATISNAYIQFVADETNATATSLTIEGEASDDASTFTTSPNNMTARPRTAASVPWSPPAWIGNEAGPAQQTQNIATIIQEIVDRSGWSSGNAIVLIITGSGNRDAETYEGSTNTDAPVLHVEYTTGGGPSNLAPNVRAGLDQSITLPADATLDGMVSDDGLPIPPGVVTTTWSKVSGPGTVTFGDETAVDTTASFSAAGTYVLRLTADDSQFTSNDEVTITVNPANQAPTVNAGLDQSITLPAEATLEGTVTDDGLPNPPGAVTATWSQVSGSGVATFGDATAVDTTASFSEAGTYILRLTANDGNLSAFDEVTITVASSSGNLPPSVNAGSDQTITLPAEATLDGTVTDDGLPNPPGVFTTTWGVVSGPGTVTFGNASAVDTTVSFSAAGTYVLQLEADDGELTAFDEVTITVDPEPINEAPAVNAGPDQTITLPDSAALDGTVTDDGLPSPPGVVTTTWSVVSGTGVVTFTNENAEDTTASFSEAGTYILRLTANDDDLAAFDEVTVTVNPEPVNQAPLVNAGLDQGITLPAEASLDGTVTDDGLPEPSLLTTNWSQVSGPGTVTFANANAVDTTASFSAAGTYVVRLTADDGQFTTSDEVTIIANETVGGTLEVRISTSSDDAEETGAGIVDLTSSDLDLAQKVGGLRFSGLSIPPGATIVSAYMAFSVDVASTSTTSLTIAGQAADNPPTFANSNGNITARTKTAASINWAPTSWPTIGVVQQTPDLSAIIEEIVNRPGWASGNALVLITTIGAGKREAITFDGSSTQAPLLHIEYTN